MGTHLRLEPDRYFPSSSPAREIAQELYNSVKDFPIISPHGHTDPRWFAENNSFGNATELLLIPDHYILRMLYSQGISLEKLGVDTKSSKSETKPRDAWRLFAEHYHLFFGTPSWIWLEHVFRDIFQINVPFSKASADLYFDEITEKLAEERFKPRALMDRFNISFLATTEGSLDPLKYHKTLREEGWGQRIVTTFRPDDTLDPDNPEFLNNLNKLSDITGEDTGSWTGYLNALRNRRVFFKKYGATATDHGHPTARTADLSKSECVELFSKVRLGNSTRDDNELFRAQMLTEMAAMSQDDGMVMQIHPGSRRNHNRLLFERFGPDKGADIPAPISYVNALSPLLNKFGNNPNFNLIVFTLDESTYSRELAPLAGHYPCMILGPAWWFHDSPEGMLRYRRQTTETAGFYNTAGFNDDTRAFLSIPARHDLARRMDSRFLAELVAEKRMRMTDALRVVQDLTTTLVRRAYKIK